MKLLFLALCIFVTLVSSETLQQGNSTDLIWWTQTWTTPLGARKHWTHHVTEYAKSLRYTFSSSAPIDYFLMTTTEFQNYINKRPFSVLEQALSATTFAGEYNNADRLSNGTVLVASNLNGNINVNRLTISISALLPTNWREISDAIAKILGAVLGSVFSCCLFCCTCICACCVVGCLVSCCCAPAKQNQIIYVQPPPTVYVEKQPLVTQQTQYNPHFQAPQQQYQPQFHQQQPQPQPYVYGGSAPVYPNL